ncbi:hypothetical protein [Saccharomonospora saliphila]|uniref:hypothetical protein n=1 Tax=Saccharomonospora saliphila TaxID=369829 RepID=UPI00037C5CFC|nr:hypothetical protein [Saccharomonospora saliphila]
MIAVVEDLAFELATLLLVGTPLALLGKLVHALTTRRHSFAPPGTRRARAEPVVWLLLGAVDFHVLAFWSTFTLQPEDLCTPHALSIDTGVRRAEGSFFAHPAESRCVWPDGSSVNMVPWPLNAGTAVCVAAAVAVAGYGIVRSRRRRHPGG